MSGGSKITDFNAAYFFAKDITIRFSGVILKCCKPSIATPACISLSNSTKAIPFFPGTRRTSLKPGNLGIICQYEVNEMSRLFG